MNRSTVKRGAPRWMVRRRLSAKTFPWLMAAFLALMGGAWIMGSPPATPPDESAHYVKALGAGEGDLYGEPPTVTRADREAFLRLSRRERSALRAVLREEEIRWQRRTRRTFSVPAGLGFTAFGCSNGRPEVSAGCLDRGRASVADVETGTYTGTYQPYVYVLPGLLMRATQDPFTAMRLGRLGMAGLSLGLLLIAALLLWERSRGAMSLIGLFAALTPAALYFSTTLNPSGPEIAAGICFCASLLRLTRQGEKPAWVWWAVAVAGGVLAAARSLGPAVVCLIAGAVVMVVGPSRALKPVLASPGRAVAAGAGITAAAAAGLAWEIFAQPHPHWSVADLAREVGPSVSRLVEIGREAVGEFGTLDTPFPWPVPLVWGILLLALIATAARNAERPAGRSLILAAAGVVAATLVVSVVYRRTGFELQGRYVLPFLVILPLCAGELLQRRGNELGDARGRLLLGAAAVAAGAHFLGWWVAARRFAVGTDGPWFFIPEAEWVPVGGWSLWATVALAGGACYLLAGFAATGAALSRGNEARERDPGLSG